MDVKVTKEIRDYKEHVFFGLSTWQFVCAAGSVGIAGVIILTKGVNPVAKMAPGFCRGPWA